MYIPAYVPSQAVRNKTVENKNNRYDIRRNIDEIAGYFLKFKHYIFKSWVPGAAIKFIELDQHWFE